MVYHQDGVPQMGAVGCEIKAPPNLGEFFWFVFCLFVCFRNTQKLSGLELVYNHLFL